MEWNGTASDSLALSDATLGPGSSGIDALLGVVASRMLAYPTPARKEPEPMTDLYSDSEQVILCWTVRFGGLASFFSGLYMFCFAWNRRKRSVFHRLMLAISFHLLLWSPWQVYGTAAVPAGTPDTYGAVGNTATCTAQGFFRQMSGMCIVLYYAGLSIYSWALIVHGNFDPNKYSFIEDYIHAAVHTFPIGSAVYLLSIQGYNSNGLTCYIASIPFGCGDDSGITCERGPQNITATIWAAAGAPALFAVLFPTTVMLFLVFRVCRIYYTSETAAQSRKLLFGMTPGTVGRQSAVYLGAIYLIYFPQFAYKIITIMGDRKNFGAAVATSALNTSRGLWIALVYWNFSSYGHSAAFGGLRFRWYPECLRFWKPKVRLHGMNKSDAIQACTENTPTESEEISVVVMSVVDEEGQESGSDNSFGIMKQKRGRQQHKKKKIVEKPPKEPKYDFNIFDGTNVAGGSASPFSQFVFDGDEEDAAIDNTETKFWSGCQDVNSTRTALTSVSSEKTVSTSAKSATTELE